jgi:hypothetical protein
MIDVKNDMLYNAEPVEESLNERLFQEEPIIAGRKVRPYNTKAKLKINKIIKWLGNDSEIGDELFLAAIYVIAAPIERMALNTLNKTAYLIDKEKFFDEISDEDLKKVMDWINEVIDLEKKTTFEIVPKPSSSSGETPPPNS